MLEDGERFVLSQFDRRAIRFLARPFYNVLTGLESSVLVAYPTAANGVVHRGAIEIDAQHCISRRGCSRHHQSRLQQWLRHELVEWLPAADDGACRFACWLSLFAARRFDLTIVEHQHAESRRCVQHPRSVRRREHVQRFRHRHDDSSISAVAVSVELLSKIALRQHSQPGRTSTATRRLLRRVGLPSSLWAAFWPNGRTSASYQTDEFAVVPELGLTVGYQLNPCWKVTAGYTWLYWSRVARAGDQIDRNLNPDLFPEEANPPADDHLRPRFRFVHDDFWAHGLRAWFGRRW